MWDVVMVFVLWVLNGLAIFLQPHWPALNERPSTQDRDWVFYLE